MEHENNEAAVGVVCSQPFVTGPSAVADYVHATSIPSSSTLKLLTTSSQPSSTAFTSCVLSVSSTPKVSVLSPSSCILSEPSRPGPTVASSKGKPYTISLVQQEQRMKSPATIPQAKQLSFSLLQSQLQSKITDTVSHPVLVTSSASAVSGSWPRAVLQSLPSAGLRLSTHNLTAMPANKPIAASAAAPELRLPGVLALSGEVTVF